MVYCHLCGRRLWERGWVYAPNGAPDGSLLRTLELDASGVSSFTFSADRATLASASVDETVRLWGVAGP